MDKGCIAFFGPRGSNTELALIEHLAPKQSTACHSIAEVFVKVAAGEVQWGFVPLENILQGPVAETLDLLLEYRDQVHISRGYLSEIIHCIGVLPANDPHSVCKQKIAQVYSHEQALRQCAKHLLKHYPDAELCPSPSTAAAVSFVKDKQLYDAAVIAPYSTLTANGFEILAENISDLTGNKTRFALLGRGSAAELESEIPQPAAQGGQGDTQFTTSIVIDPGRDRQGILYEILEVISVKHRVNLSSIHSRPDSRGGFVFHLDLEGHISEEPIKDCLNALRQYCLDHTGQTAEIIICGSYPRTKFHSLPFNTVGIVGGGGAMGKWFNRFLSGAGLEVLVSEKSTGLSLKDLAQEADVILLSVPMSQAAAVGRELCPHLRPNQLLVENCSIKSCVLPLLLELCPKEVEVLGIHTMFGGDLPSLRGENVIITKTERSRKRAQAFEDLLYKYGAKTTYASIEEHDKRVAFLQALIHFTALS
ncbi:MAG TPA: prephenate dehydrogenase/arogenate dehydrogenase family protein, partial [Oligoflexia bacterium]|nr:prephenate dehydrogenase/arogenate dehydrogenase family protein [Oligoflexia bacterium]